MRRAFVGVMLAGGVLAAVACTELFEEAVQCKSPRDCEKFSAQCDLAQGICVPFGSLPGEEAGIDAPIATEDASDGPVLPDPCAVNPKPTAAVPSMATADAGDSEITGSITLDCSKDWILRDRVLVRSGATLIIEPGTTIRADANAAIVIRPGGKILAEGQRERPIVMTPNKAADPQPGDWRGLFVLGAAPPTGTYGGDTAYAWGGTTAADSSGTLEFVRIEYAGDGLVLGGVGSGTKIDHVQVRKPGDNCFVLTGGRFSAKHLVCQYPIDEMFEISAGYQGRLQFLYGQKVNLTGAGHNGLLVDQNAFPTVYNATLCGEDQANQSYGFHFRNNGRFDVNNAIFTGWLGAVEATGALGTPLLMRGSLAYANTANPAAAETDGGAGNAADDDNGFDEVGFFGDGGTNKTTNAGLVACFDPNNPQPWPPAALTTDAVKPPTDGFFDDTATFIGAFRDANDAWMKGAWVRFSDQ